jgi:hypothetical protein
MSLTSVAGGDDAAGNWSAIAGLCGPGSVRLAGFFALTAPCGGRSGLPNEAARAPAERTDAAAIPPAPAPSRPRLVTSTTPISEKSVIVKGMRAAGQSTVASEDIAGQLREPVAVAHKI